MRDISLTALAPLAWGTTYLVTTAFLPSDRPLLAGAMRALPVGLLLVAYFRRLPTGAWWWRILVLGLLNIGLFFALLFLAAYRLPGGVAATLGAFQPFLVALFAWPFLGDRPAPRTLAAAAASVLGVGLLVLGPTARLDAVGATAGLAGTVVMAMGTVLTKRWGRPAPLLLFTAWQLVAGGLILAPLALLVEGPLPSLTTRNAIGFAYLGIVNTGLAYAFWFRGIERLRASAVTFLALLSPVVATALGFLILQQSLSMVQIGGALLVLASVVSGQRAALRPVRIPRVQPARTIG